MKKIVPNFWFDSEAEEAAKFYVSIFRDGKIHEITYYGKSGAEISGQPEDSVLTVNFELNGQKFTALNGGPDLKFNGAVSFLIECEDQAEVDYYWEKLLEGGSPQQCGWLTDKFGLNWQVVPAKMDEWMVDPDKEKVERVLTAMFKMVKLDEAELQRAFDGG